MAPPAPLVSIVIPAYNAAAHVASAIDSVLAQSFRDIELIVVDDGSADDTAARVQAYGAAVRCLRQPNRGVSRARNRGVEQSHGRLVAFLDADDVWRVEKLARQLEALRRRTDSRACYTNATIADPDLRPLGEQRSTEGSVTVRSLLRFGNVVPGGGSSVLCERDLLAETGGFDPDLSLCADWDMWLRMAVRTPFAGVDEALVVYRCSPNSMSRNVHLLERDTMRLLHGALSLMPDPRLRRRVLGHHYRVLSGSYFRDGRLAGSLRCLLRAVRHDPRQALYALTWPARAMRRRATSPPAVLDLPYSRDYRG